MLYVVVAAVNVFQTRGRCIFNARQKEYYCSFRNKSLEEEEEEEEQQQQQQQQQANTEASQI